MLMVEWRSLDIDGSDDFGVYGAEGPGNRSGEVQPSEQYCTLVGSSFSNMKWRRARVKLPENVCSLMDFPSRFKDTAKCASPFCLAGHRAKERIAAYVASFVT